MIETYQSLFCWLLVIHSVLNLGHCYLFEICVLVLGYLAIPIDPARIANARTMIINSLIGFSRHIPLPVN
jgi:hypothetical protein